MTETGTDSPGTHVVVVCMICMRAGAAFAADTGLNCTACRNDTDFFHCPRCRWPLIVFRDAPTMTCPGCGTHTDTPLRNAQPAAATEVSYFQGLIAVSPNNSDVAVHPACTAIATWAMPFHSGVLVSLAATANELHMTPIGVNATPVVWPLSDVITLTFDGPGRVTTGRRFWGGGFGLVGAAEGILAAELLNKLTSKTTVNSFITAEINGHGVILHTGRLTPQQLRFTFAGAVHRVNAPMRSGVASDPQESESGIAEQLVRLHSLHRDGALTAEEYQRAKWKILE